MHFCHQGLKINIQTNMHYFVFWTCNFSFLVIFLSIRWIFTKVHILDVILHVSRMARIKICHGM